MHAYLVVGKDSEKIEGEIVRLAKEMGAKIMSQEVKSIADIRELNRFVGLSFEESTAILIRDFDSVTEEASNAFLKSLEEPGANVSFILTASNVHSLLPTIVSRCVVVSVGNSTKASASNRKGAVEFVDSGVGEKFEMIDGIRHRDEAIEFMTELIEGLHAELVGGGEAASIADCLEAASGTLIALQKNGNVNLQLTNFVVSVSD